MIMTVVGSCVEYRISCKLCLLLSKESFDTMGECISRYSKQRNNLQLCAASFDGPPPAAA